MLAVVCPGWPNSRAKKQSLARLCQSPPRHPQQKLHRVVVLQPWPCIRTRGVTSFKDTIPREFRPALRVRKATLACRKPVLESVVVQRAVAVARTRAEQRAIEDYEQ